MYPHRKNNAGFTLVELAIVLMIIGLLIGGILRGQELINNARVTMTLRQLKSFDAAAITFKDSYGSLPGDLLSPSTRLPNCTTTPCSTAGNGNGVIDPNYTEPFYRPSAIADEVWTDERINFWIHMVKANLISGDSSPNQGDWRTIFPLTNFNKGGVVLWSADGTPRYSIMGPTLTDGALSVQVTAQIDRKIDDGKPFTGDAKTMMNGVSADSTCVTGSGATATYTESASGGMCDLVVKSSL